jgi:protein-disulfide isomerase
MEEENKEIETNEENSQNPLMIPFAIIIAGVIVGASVIYAMQGNSKSVAVQNNNNQQQATAAGSVLNQQQAAGVGSVLDKMTPVSTSDHILGDINAPVKIVEYSDLECPYCKVFDATMHQIVQSYGNKVAWIYRQYPIPQLHPKAPHESVASECAAQLGGNTIFWKYIDEIFKITPSNNGLDPTELITIASGLGLDMNAFNQCLSSTKYDSLIASQSQEATNVGSQGTPYSIVISPKGNKYPIDGALPYSAVKQIVDTALSN